MSILTGGSTAIMCPASHEGILVKRYFIAKFSNVESRTLRQALRQRWAWHGLGSHQLRRSADAGQAGWLATGCGFLKAVKFGCKPPWSWIFCRRQRIG